MTSSGKPFSEGELAAMGFDGSPGCDHAESGLSVCGWFARPYLRTDRHGACVLWRCTVHAREGDVSLTREEALCAEVLVE